MAIVEMQPLNYALLIKALYRMFLVVFVFRPWRMVVKMLAIVETLSRLPAYITHRFQRPPPPPPTLGFLDLPPEIRNIVYGHMATLYWTEWHRLIAGKAATLPVVIFKLNRQVYNEAAHVLFSDLVLAVKVIQTEDMYRDKRLLDGAVHRASLALKYARTIHLEICWPGDHWLDEAPEGQTYGRPILALKENMETVCAWLAERSNLRVVKVTFLAKRPFPESWRPLCPAKDRLPGLLTPLLLLQHGKPELIVEPPRFLWISHTQLARQHQNYVWRIGFKEVMGGTPRNPIHWRLWRKVPGAVDGY